jgi:hypothetical protein
MSAVRVGATLLLLTFGLTGCPSPSQRGALRDEQAARRAQLQERGDELGLALWRLWHGEDPREARPHLARHLTAQPAHPGALLARVIAAELAADERELVRVARLALRAPALHRWRPSSLGYVLWRLSRSALVEDPAALQRFAARAYRSGWIPREVFVALHEARGRQGGYTLVGPLADTPLTAFWSGFGDDGTATPFAWSGQEAFPDWLPNGVYRLRADTPLEAGVRALMVLRSRNPVRIRGVRGGPISLNEPERTPRSSHAVEVIGDGRPLTLDLFLATPDPGLSITLLPAAPGSVAFQCEAGPSGEEGLHALAGGLLALGLDAPAQARACVAGWDSPGHDLVRALADMQRPHRGDPGRTEAYRAVTHASERMPGATLSRLVIAQWFEDTLEPEQALAHLDAGEAASPDSPSWTTLRRRVLGALGLRGDVARLDAQARARWGLDGDTLARLRLPWEPRRPVPASSKRAGLVALAARGELTALRSEVDALLAVGVPSRHLGRARLHLAPWATLDELLPELDPMEASELAGIAGRPAFWRELQTSLDALLTLSLNDAVNGRPATVLLQEAVVTRHLIYVHRAVRLDTEEGVRQLGQWRLPNTPMLIHARAIKPDRSVQFPDIHGASSMAAFSGLEVGDVIEVAWIEERDATEISARAFRYIPLQDDAFPTSLTCFAVVGEEDERPEIHLDAKRVWLFEREGALSDGTPFARWCTRRVPPISPEAGMFQPDMQLAHVVVYPSQDPGQTLARIHESLWAGVRRPRAIDELGRSLRQRFGDRAARIRAATEAVTARVEAPTADPFTATVADTWERGTGCGASALVALLNAAEIPARLALVNPLEASRDTSKRVTASDYYVSLVLIPGDGGEDTWIDASQRPPIPGWLPARLRDRPAVSFGFPGAPAMARTPARVDEPDRLALELRCDGRCEVRLSARGVHRAWVESQLAQLEGEDELGPWLTAIVRELLPGIEDGDRAWIERQDGELRVGARARLNPGQGGRVRFVPFQYGQVLLERFGQSPTRQFPLYLDGHLHLEVTLELDDHVPQEPVAIDESSSFFGYELHAVDDGGDAVVRARFDMDPQIIPPDVYVGFRQNLLRVARPPVIELAPD